MTTDQSWKTRKGKEILANFLSSSVGLRIRTQVGLILKDPLATATILLACGTFWMVYETRRLADFTVDQFKIKSYPLLEIMDHRISIKDRTIKEDFHIDNKGEITAFKMGIHQAFVYEKEKNRLVFIDPHRTFYNTPERVLGIEASLRCPPNAARTYTTEGDIPTGYTKDHLRYKLILIRFKVPYDTKYRYDVHCFTPTQVSGNLHWNQLRDDASMPLIEQYMDQPKDKFTRTFLKDFSLDDCL